jgi:carbon-monoxide dehydrogenase large subunit
MGKGLQDIPLLALDRVRFVGEKVAVVAAESSDIAEEAIHAIDVEYEDLPAVCDVGDALKPGAPVIHPGLKSYQPASGREWPEIPSLPNANSQVLYKKGDVQRGFEESARTFEDVFKLPMQHHAFIEPHSCTVTIDESGKVRVWTSIKQPFAMRDWLAQATGLERKQFVMLPVQVGGDFGGKAYLWDEALAYFLARTCGRPIRMVTSQNDEFLGGIHRHAATIRIKSGVNGEGKLTARQVEILFNNGAYAGYRPHPTVGGAAQAAGCYRIPHVQISSTHVYTNQGPCGHMRGPGEPQVGFAVESHTDMIARRLGIDPVEFRQRNVMREGDEGPLGKVWHSVTASEVVTRAVAAVHWNKPKKENTGRGLAVCERSTGRGRARVAIEINERGQVLVRTGLTEIGTGAHTVLRQVLALAFHIDPSEVLVQQGDTEQGPYDQGSNASKVTNTTGGAVLVAARNTLPRIFAAAAELKGWSHGAVSVKRGRIVCKGKTGHVAFRDAARHLAKHHGGIFREEAEMNSVRGDAYGYACQAVELTVDRETGAIRIHRIVAIQDVGYAINPQALTGQIAGAIAQGLGLGLTEEMRYDNGYLEAVNFGAYKIPCVVDVPPISYELIENKDGPGPFGSKGVGEVAAVPIMAAIANAVEDAVGVRITELPITAEKVLSALKDH